MSHHPSHQSDKHGLMDLIGVLCNGTIDCNQLSLLERRLLESADARAVYRRYLNLHASLRRCSVMEQNATCRTSNYPILSFLGDRVQWTREYFSQPGPFSVLVAAIFMVCVISILNILPAPTYEPSRSSCAYNSSGTGFQGVNKNEKLKLVARITGKHNCRWSPDGRAPLSYDHMGIGRELKLDSGLVEITYYNGAKVVLEGPVEFTVEQKNACRLDFGRLTAKVSKDAVGFTVETPGLTVVDLGTEFAVQVRPTGTAEVHVFEGETEVTYDAGAGNLRQIRVVENQSVRFNTRSQGIVRGLANHEQFARVEPRPGPVVRFFTDESAWRAAVEKVETFRTTGANVAMAAEVKAPPGRDASLGPVLTYTRSQTGLSWDFRLKMLEPGSGPGHGFVFNDTSNNPEVPPAFINALAVGKGDQFEDDDWQVEITSGPKLFALGFDLCDNSSSEGESLSVYGSEGALLASTKVIPSGPHGTVAFVGVVSAAPITKIIFDEDRGGDDIAIADFRFANPLKEQFR